MNLVSLNQALIDSGCNQTDCVVTLVKACIEGGVDSGPEIVSEVSSLGFNKRFVGITLTKSAGRTPDRFPWVRGDDGRYRLHS